MGAENGEPVDRIDAALKYWRQGDVALEETWFIHAGDPATPLSAAASEAEQSGLQGLLSDVEGLVVISQTCDIVRSCGGERPRPYIEVCPLIDVDDEELHHIARGRQPSRGYVPGVADRKLVADLDRTMTVEKSLVADWRRTEGCRDDDEAREFAQALARKRARFAFPDDFTELIKKLRKRLTEKHARDSDEGRALRELREIRVTASPSWTASKVSLFFYFVRDDGTPEADSVAWDTRLSTWLSCMETSGPYEHIGGVVSTLDELTASDYVHSDRLDLEHLSSTASD